MATSQPHPLGKERARGLVSTALAGEPRTHPNRKGPRPAAEKRRGRRPVRPCSPRSRPAPSGTGGKDPRKADTASTFNKASQMSTRSCS